MSNILRDKSFAFASRVVKACRYLAEQQREFVLSKQLLGSGTAIGALVREAEYAETKPDFIHKMALARKEANETLYGLELLVSTNLSTPRQAESLHLDATELLKMLTSSIKTAKTALTSTPKN
ncbi:four helix bundle protein [Hymenobacter sp. RP-2-7]|uniref:Four helix bundle protein n=1 Tax=Hymenobacter polaris TaxID=2682546 RepID=A0A7Y0AAR1_9BACT|nr:four helix bundle protein [Hymenobacter polaris]NML63863.1 four helix bundle protein [Hymenobacter polaris]